MDIARTPLAGRQPENLGEDPFLAGETVAQEVAGAKSRHVIATLKHYVANNAEWGRIGFNTADRAHAAASTRIVSERGAAGDLRGAVQARDPQGARGRGHVLLQPPQRAADVRERGAALRSEGLGLRRLRRPGLHLRGQGPAGRDARRASTSPPSAAPAGGRPRCSPRARCPPRGCDDIVRRTLLRDVRLGRLRRPARAGGRRRQHARAHRRWRRASPSAAWCC